MAFRKFETRKYETVTYCMYLKRELNIELPLKKVKLLVCLRKKFFNKLK